ncbi:APC family permease [Inquilinus limosus]
MAAVLSLRNYPVIATYGWSSITWYLMGTIFFIIPLSLVTAELASAWPEDGGVFIWVREAFGEKWGLVAVWCAFSQNLIWYPTVLSYVTVALASAFVPELLKSATHSLAIMLGILWMTILANLWGPRFTSRLSSFGVIVGTLVPGGLIIVLWIGWILLDKPNAIPFEASALVPDLSPKSLPFAAALVLMFAGIEISGYYASSVRNPQAEFPKAVLLAAVTIFIMSVLPTLALAWVLPVSRIDLNAGVIQVLGLMLDELGLTWMSPGVSFSLAVGGVALMTAWMVSPALGLGVVARAGLLPPIWSRYNRRGIPVGVMIIQGIAGSTFTILYMVMPSVNSAYWIMSAMTTEVLTVMYLLVFSSLIRLRYTRPQHNRPYRIPGGLTGVWTVGGVGLIALLFSGYFGLLPPDRMPVVSAGTYMLVMLSGTIVLAFFPLIFPASRRGIRQDVPPFVELR